MRKNWLLLLTIFFSLGLGFTSCGDDDDDPIVEETVFGVYKGTMDITVDGKGLIVPENLLKNIPQKIYLDKVGENKAKFLLKDFSFGSMSFGNIEIKSADIRNTGSEYKVNGTDKVELARIGTCDVDLDGTIVGEKINWTVNVNVIEGDLKGLKVNVKFAGEKLAADQSSEAEILTFEFKAEDADVNKLVTKVDIQDNKISLRVSDETTEEDLKKLVPTITISDKATLSPESGTAQDFSNPSKPVVYTVKSEDGIKENKYTVSIASTVTFFDFEEWEIEAQGDPEKLETAAYKPLSEFWSTSNTGAIFLQGLTGRYSNVEPSGKEDAYNGSLNAGKVETLDSKGVPIIGNIYSPKITSGTLFIGVFDLDIFNTLKSTKFGVAYDKKPLAVIGQYKYKAGAEYHYCPDPKKYHLTEVKDIKDECSIGVYLYEYDAEKAESDTRYTTYLTGENIKTSDKVIAKAELKDGTDKAEYTEFRLDLDYIKEYDKEKSYRLAIVTSSSKDGDKFSGAPGSVLFIDNVEIINE